MYKQRAPLREKLCQSCGTNPTTRESTYVFFSYVLVHIENSTNVTQGINASLLSTRTTIAMGAKHLWDFFLQDIKKNKSQNLSDYKGKRFGVDLSIWLHQVLSLDEVVLSVNCIPPYPPTAIRKVLTRRIRCLRRNEIEPVIFTDGVPHPMKVSARLVRDSPKKVSSQNLEIFYAKGKRGDKITEEERISAQYKLVRCNQDYPSDRQCTYSKILPRWQ